MVPILEIMELVGILMVLTLLLSEPGVGPPLELTLPGVLQPLHWLLHAHVVPPLEGAVLDVAVLGGLHEGGGGVELAAVGPFIDFELEDFLVCIHEVLILVLIF